MGKQRKFQGVGEVQALPPSFQLGLLSGRRGPLDQLSRCLLRMGMMVVAVMIGGVEWEEGPYGSSGVI